MNQPPRPNLPAPPAHPPDISAQLADSQKKNPLGGNLGGTFITGGQAWAPKTTGQKSLLGL